MESAGTSGNVYQSPRSKCFLFMCTNHLDQVFLLSNVSNAFTMFTNVMLTQSRFHICFILIVSM